MPSFEIVEVEAQPALVMSGTIVLDQLPDFFGRAFATVMAHLEAAGVAPAGPPFGYYRSPPTDTVELSAGMPVAVAVEPSGALESIELPGGRVARGVHVGPYDTLHQTYAELSKWMADARLVPAPTMWESYLTDPGEAPPEEWQTVINWPIEHRERP